jgi:hypothetical protein
MMQVRLPVPHPNGAKNADLQLPDSDAIIHAYDIPGRWSQIEDLLKFAVVSLEENPPGPHDIREMPVKSADSLLKEIYLGFKNEPTINWHPDCSDCGHQMHFRQEDGTAISIHDLECRIAPFETYEECKHTVVLTNPLPLIWDDLNGPIPEGTVTELHFSQPLIRHMIDIEKDATLRGKPAAASRKTLKMCLAGVEGSDLIPFKEIKNRYINQLMNFKDPENLAYALQFLLLYGIDPRKTITCPNCCETQIQGVPFGNFFASSLPGAK